MIYKPGEVVLIPFPFTDFTTLKQRPALIISGHAFNRTHSDVVILAITSRLGLHPRSDEHRFSEREQRAAGLPKQSAVKLGKVTAVDQRLIRRRLGMLPEEAMKQISRQFRNIIGLDE